MYQTLFVIPRQVAGVDTFGFGWLLAAWAVGCVALVAYTTRRYGWGSEARGLLPAMAVVGLAIAFVLPGLIEPSGLPIRGYGVMLLLAVLAGIGLSIHRARQVGLDPELIWSLGTWFFVSGILGARVFYIIEYWPNFQKETWTETLVAMVNLTQGGLVVYGSLLAGGAALLVFLHRHHLPGLAFADLIAPGVVLGVGLGRIGCFLNGCCYGGITDVPWAVQFPIGSPAYVDQASQGKLYVHGLIFEGRGSDRPVIAEVEPDSPAAHTGLATGDVVERIDGARVHSVEEAQFELFKVFGQGRQLTIDVAGQAEPHVWTIAAAAPRSLPVHPTQLYSLFDALLLCAFLLLYEPYKRRDGELTALVLVIHPITRFLLEIIRVDEAPVFHTGMSISQNISIAILIGGLCLWAYLSRRRQCIIWPGQLAAA